MNLRDKFKGKVSKEQLQVWVAKTRSQIIHRSQILGPKIKSRLEKIPPLLELLKRLPEQRLLLSALAAFFVADILMLGLAFYLTPKDAPPRRPRSRIVELEPRLRPQAHYSSTISKNIFCPACPIPELKIKKIEKPKDCDLAAPMKSGTKLIGTIVLSDPQYSVATLTQGSDTIAVQKGDEVPGVGQVFEIRQGRVCILKPNDDLVFVELPEEPMKFGIPIDQPVSYNSSGAPKSRTPGIDQISETDFNISRNTLLEKLSDPNLLFQAHAVPHRGQNGDIEGFKILSIQPGSVYESLGVKVGDVIGGVNGDKLDSISKAQELYSTMRTASDISITVIRNGQPIELKYSIK
jgi:general secretion pathway protein C